MATDANERLGGAAYRGDVAGIADALLAGADPNALVRGYTPLLRAATFGNVATISALLAAGARVDGANTFGTTPLVYFSAHGHAAVVEVLLAAGADVHRADGVGKTSLHCASQNGHLDAARLLVDAGARTDVRNEDGNRPVDWVRQLLACVAAARSCHATTPPLCHAQVCTFADRSRAPAIRALLASAEPWSRRRPVALACYAVEWEWEA
jgi:uncharacterized protein